MRKFLINSACFAAILLVFAIVADRYVSDNLRHSKERKYAAWNGIYNDTVCYDLVINGSSRAWVHYDPHILDSILHLNTYNLGIDGSGINRQMIKYHKYCELHGQPKYLIQNIDLFTMACTFGYEQRSKFLVDAVKQMRQGNDVFSKTLQDKLEVMNKSPQKKVVTHRFEPTSKNVLLFIGGLALSLVISIWGNLTQWREHQDWEEADLKYRALKMVLPSDDPNIRYIEKHFNVQRDEDIIDNLRNRVAVYEDSVRRHYEMFEMAVYKDSLANRLLQESEEIKSKFVNR